MNKKNIDYEKENSIIDTLAYQIKFGQTSKTSMLTNEIMRHILIVKGFSYYLDFDKTVIDQTLEEVGTDDNYSGKVIMETYNDVMRIYGMKDQTTGTIIPFMKLFNNLWNLRKNKIIKEKIEEIDYYNAKAKESSMRTFLKKNLKSSNQGDKRFNVLNIDKVTKALEENNSSPAVIQEAQFIMANNIVSADSIVDDENNEDSGTCQSDAVVIYDYEAADSAITTIVDGIEYALKNAKSPVIKRFILIHANIEFLNFVPSIGNNNFIQLKKYADKDLLRYLFQVDIDDEVQAVANYLKLERETVRKNLKKAKQALKEALIALTIAEAA